MTSRVFLGCVLVAALLFAATDAQATVIVQGFETDTSGWTAWPASSSSTITRVASGTNGITSSSGGYHAEIFMDASVFATPTARGGAYTYPGGAMELLPGFGKVTYSVDVYMDPTVGAVGEEWNMQVALDYLDGPGGSLVGTKTFSFVARKTEPGKWTLGRNSGTPAPIEITTAGWFTMSTEWTETAGGIVDYNYIDDGVTQYEVGPGVNMVGETAAAYRTRYMWLFLDGVDDTSKTVAIDNATFEFTDAAVPEPTTLAIWGTLGGLGLIAGRRRKRTA